jgi:hypothetical protein
MPMLASDVTSLAALCTVLLAHIAVSWTIGGMLGALADVGKSPAGACAIGPPCSSGYFRQSASRSWRVRWDSA